MHVKVVNSYEAASLLVPVKCDNRVDFPTDGNLRQVESIDFNSYRIGWDILVQVIATGELTQSLQL